MQRFLRTVMIGIILAPPLSPIRRASLAQGGPLTFHQSPNLSLLANHGRASGLAVRFEDLFLAFSPGASLWRLAFRTPAFAKPTARQDFGDLSRAAVRVLESGCQL